MTEPVSVEAEILAELGIGKGKMRGVTSDGLRVEQDAGGARITVELVGRFDQATANRLLDIIDRADTRCRATMSPGQGQTLQCGGSRRHDGRHHQQGWSWIDGDDDDARVEGQNDD